MKKGMQEVIILEKKERATPRVLREQKLIVKMKAHDEGVFPQQPSSPAHLKIPSGMEK